MYGENKSILYEGQDINQLKLLIFDKQIIQMGIGMAFRHGIPSSHFGLRSVTLSPVHRRMSPAE